MDEGMTMRELEVAIAESRQTIAELNSRKRMLADELMNLEWEIDEARDEMSGLAEDFWVERLRLDRLETTLNKLTAG